MGWHKAVLVLGVALLLSGCELLSQATPTATPAPAATPTPTPDLQREAMIAFTRQALQIEAKRSNLLDWFASMPNYIRDLLLGRYFFVGVVANTYPYTYPPTSDLEGMESLQNRLLLLTCPQTLQSVKDSLASIYSSEIALVSRDANIVTLLDVTKDNLDYWKQKLAEFVPNETPYYYIYNPTESHSYLVAKVNSDWFRLQSFRRDVYIKWAQILGEHGIDPASVGISLP